MLAAMTPLVCSDGSAVRGKPIQLVSEEEFMEDLLNRLIPLLVQQGVIVIMFSAGLQVTGSQILAAIRQRRLLAKALLANFVVLPIIALLLSRLVNMPTGIAIGFLLAAVTPGAPFSTKLAGIGNADIPFAVGIMFVLAVMATFTTPLVASLLLPAEATVQFDSLQVVLTLVKFQLIPLLVGLAVHHWWNSVARRLERPSIVLANIYTAAVVSLLIIRDYRTLISIPWPSLAAMVLLTIASLLIGWYFGGPDPKTRRALALGTSIEFSGGALLVINNNFSDTTAAIGVVAFILVVLVVNITVALYWNRSRQGEGLSREYET
jgi:BASS family bile acid:Na+ symporter